MIRRLALVSHVDSSDPGAWSGTLAGLQAGMSQHDVELTPVWAGLKGVGAVTARLGMSSASLAASDSIAVAIGLKASASLARDGGLDGAVRIGSGFELATRLPVVTFDDMTVPQAIEQPGSEYEALAPAARRRWIGRQARAMRSATACCFGSNWAAQSARANLGVPAAKASIVGLGSSFRQLRGERDWSTPRFLFVGFDWERKRGDAVVDAFAAIRVDYPDATLDLVGGHPRVDAPGVTGHGPLSLSSTAERALLLDLFRRATCFVMPSHFEPFGIAYVEAGMAGIASIGTTVGGAADAIGAGGVLVAPDDLGALSVAMRRLSRSGEASRLGQMAAVHAAGLSWPSVAGRILAAFEPRAA